MSGTEIMKVNSYMDNSTNILIIVDKITVNNTNILNSIDIIYRDEAKISAKIIAEELNKQYQAAQNVADMDKQFYEEKKKKSEENDEEQRIRYKYVTNLYTQCCNNYLNAQNKWYAEAKKYECKDGNLEWRWSWILGYVYIPRPSENEYMQSWKRANEKFYNDMARYKELKFSLIPLEKKANESMAIATELKTRRDIAWNLYEDNMYEVV
jgi:hypothetical protein